MQNHYSIPVCESASITGTIPLTVTMESQTGDPCPGMPLYVFDSDSYTRYHGTLEINGVVEFTLLRKRGFTTCKRWPMKLVIDT